MLKSNAKASQPQNLNSFSKSRYNANQISASEMRFLAEVAKMGRVKSEGDLIHLLRFLRDALHSRASKPS